MHTCSICENRRASRDRLYGWIVVAIQVALAIVLAADIRAAILH